MTTELQWAEAWVELSKDVRSACLVGMLGDGFHSDAFSNEGAARAGVGGLPGVLSTKVFVLLRPGEVTDTLAISASGTGGLTLSVASLLVSMH